MKTQDGNAAGRATAMKRPARRRLSLTGSPQATVPAASATVQDVQASVTSPSPGRLATPANLAERRQRNQTIIAAGRRTGMQSACSPAGRWC
ncbi:hypothetical protein MJ584_14105 [Klebsiella pneumoniae]|nr:hypothetical protein MJ584_14105 [Klebsiella pneumoniae]